jgi:hypothetical protein
VVTGHQSVGAVGNVARFLPEPVPDERLMINSSIWKAEVATPHTNPAGRPDRSNASVRGSVTSGMVPDDNASLPSPD